MQDSCASGAHSVCSSPSSWLAGRQKGAHARCPQQGGLRPRGTAPCSSAQMIICSDLLHCPLPAPQGWGRYYCRKCLTICSKRLPLLFSSAVLPLLPPRFRKRGQLIKPRVAWKATRTAVPTALAAPAISPAFVPFVFCLRSQASAGSNWCHACVHRVATLASCFAWPAVPGPAGIGSVGDGVGEGAPGKA